jgi:hypothetical protein
MRTSYFIRLALILGWQASMIAAMFLSPQYNWMTHAFIVSSLLVPFIGYFLAFYDAPAFADLSRITRPVVLTISFAIATAVGFWVLLFLIFVLLIAFGGHHW